MHRGVTRRVWVLLFLSATAGAQAVGRVELISRADPIPDTDGFSFSPSLSADGRYAVFLSDAPNLVPGQIDRNASLDIYLHDRVAGTTALVTHAFGLPETAAPTGAYSVLDAQISADGRFVAFSSSSPDLVPGDDNSRIDVFLYDRAAGTTTLASHASGSSEAPGNNHSYEARVSADGGAVVFRSSARNLVAGQTGPDGSLDDPPRDNVFLWRRGSGSITLVSRQAGSPSATGNGPSTGAEISGNGRFVAFQSSATNLVAGASDANATSDVFLFDNASGAVTLVSHVSGSPLATPGPGSRRPSLSADGRWIAFASDARNLVPGQIDNAGLDAFLYDRVSGETRLASHIAGSAVTAGGLAPGSLLSLSADGRSLAFASAAANLVPGQADANRLPDVFVYDRVSGTTELVSHTPGSRTRATAEAVAASSATISADGRYVAYQSGASNLVPRQTDRGRNADVFLHDRVAQTTVLVSHGPGSATTAATGESPAISGNGGVVAFVSLATRLAEGQVDPNGFVDVFLYSRASADVALVSGRDPDLPAATPHGESLATGISSDGRFVLFSSTGRGVVPGQIDAATLKDVFLRDRATGTTTLLSHTKASPLAAAGGDLSVLSADGRFAAFRAYDRPQPGADSFHLYDRTAGTAALVNHVPGSLTEPDGFAREPALSADGRYLAYACDNCTLVQGQQPGRRVPGTSDVFLYDRVTRANVLVTHASGSPLTGADTNSFQPEPRISADGRFVVFTSQATNLAAGQSGFPGRDQVFLFDRETGLNTLVSHTPASAATGLSGEARGTAISGDGRWILFWSNASDAVAGQVDGNGAYDLFLHDRTTGRTSLVSHASSSALVAGNGDTGSVASISFNGRWIAFESIATDLAAGAAAATDTNGAYDVFLHDRATGATILVSAARGEPFRAANRQSRSPRISANGGRIAFLSSATDLAPGQAETGEAVSLVVSDRARARTILPVNDGFSFSAPTPFGPPFLPWLSANGRQVAFTSAAPNLVAGDRNEDLDAFVVIEP